MQYETEWQDSVILVSISHYREKREESKLEQKTQQHFRTLKKYSNIYSKHLMIRISYELEN